MWERWASFPYICNFQRAKGGQKHSTYKSFPTWLKPSSQPNWHGCFLWSGAHIQNWPSPSTSGISQMVLCWFLAFYKTLYFYSFWYFISLKTFLSISYYHVPIKDHFHQLVLRLFRDLFIVWTFYSQIFVLHCLYDN